MFRFIDDFAFVISCTFYILDICLSRKSSSLKKTHEAKDKEKRNGKSFVTSLLIQALVSHVAAVSS